MPNHKWMDKAQPQTLQAAVLFSYLNAALAVLSLLFGDLGPSLLLLALGGAAYGIANERRLAYQAAVAIACLYLVVELVSLFDGGGFGGLLDLVFAGVVVALLLHPQSREYQHTWFH
jgi:hypothetical protein